VLLSLIFTCIQLSLSQEEWCGTDEGDIFPTVLLVKHSMVCGPQGIYTVQMRFFVEEILDLQEYSALRKYLGFCVWIGVPSFLLHSEGRFRQQALEPARQVATNKLTFSELSY
jgi:hypothetical protein